MVRIEMENGGIIDIELYEDKAPITCANFKNWLKADFTTDLFSTELLLDLWFKAVTQQAQDVAVVTKTSRVSLLQTV